MLANVQRKAKKKKACESEEEIPWEDMTEEQRRHYEVH